MKGAQGLLISITGGRDLTLFELDEAATRIREEVDPDANIILGATFDEELEGLIRVSVVATGIDRTAAEVAGRSADFRPVAAKPVVRPSAAIPAQQPQPVAQHQPAPVHQPVMQQPVAQPVQQPVQQQATADQIAAAIREAEMERELDIATRAAQAQAQAPVQPMHEENFRPQSKLFAGAAPVEAARSCASRSRRCSRFRSSRSRSRSCARSLSLRSCVSSRNRFACRRSKTFRRS